MLLHEAVYNFFQLGAVLAEELVSAEVPAVLHGSLIYVKIRGEEAALLKIVKVMRSHPYDTFTIFASRDGSQSKLPGLWDNLPRSPAFGGHSPFLTKLP